LVLPVPVDPTGRDGPTKAQAGGPRWRRVALNRYVPVTVGATPEQSIAEAATNLPSDGAVTGWGALRLAGAAYFDGACGRASAPVMLAAGPRRGRRCRAGVTWSYEPFGDDEVVHLRGVPCLHPRRALFDELRRLPTWREAVVAMDMAAAAQVTSVDRVGRYLDTHRGFRRSSLVATVLARSSERSRSPKESELRLAWVHDAGLPEPLVNSGLYDADGRFVAVPDLLDEEAGLVVEYDGEEHRSIRRHHADVHREDRCRRVGLEYCTVTAPDLHDLPRLVERLRATRARARFAPPGARRWRTGPRPDESPEQLDDVLDHRERRSRELYDARGIRVLPW
jgi:hypothetical protein